MMGNIITDMIFVLLGWHRTWFAAKVAKSMPQLIVALNA